jgi:hypothetical protein
VAVLDGPLDQVGVGELTLRCEHAVGLGLEADEDDAADEVADDVDLVPRDDDEALVLDGDDPGLAQLSDLEPLRRQQGVDRIAAERADDVVEEDDALAFGEEGPELLLELLLALWERRDLGVAADGERRRWCGPSRGCSATAMSMSRLERPGRHC